MEQLLHQFEKSVTDADGSEYRVYVHGRSRPSDTWQGWLVFERISDGKRFSTDVETTQPNAEAIVYWATGLTDAYFDGALARAQKPPAGNIAPAGTRRARLFELERDVLAAFQRRHTTRVLTQAVFDELPAAHADVVRALEDLEKQGGLLIRRTEDGNDWLFLTESGVEFTGLNDVKRVDTIVSREPPRPR